MKVRAATGVEFHGRFKPGAIYEVIELSLFGRGVMIRAFSERGTPVLHRIGDFEIIEAGLSGNWGARVNGGTTTIAPIPLLRDLFWVDYFDDVPEAIETLSQVVESLADPAS